MELDEYIKELLFYNDTIIIPNFGGFEKYTESAQIDQNTGTIHPPRVKIKFRPELTKASGVLKDYVSEKEAISKEDSEKKLAQEIQNWEENLKKNSKIKISDIGFIFLDKSANKNFELTGDLSDFPEAFGLPSINIEEQQKRNIKNLDKPVKKDIKKTVKEKKTLKKEVKKPVIKEKKPIKEPKIVDPVKRKRIIIATIIAVPIIAFGVFASLNIELVTEKFSQTTEYIGSFFSSDKTEDNLDQLDLTDSSDIKLESVVENTKQLLENYSVINAETNNPLIIDQNSLSLIKQVHIIAGSFKNKKFAKRLKNKLHNKGFSSEILPVKYNYYRVSIGSFENIEAAANDFERIKLLDSNLDVWILVN